MADIITFTKDSKWNIQGKIVSYKKGQKIAADSIPPKIREDMLDCRYATLSPHTGGKEKEPPKSAKVVNPVAETKEAQSDKAGDK